jgi:diguanylate cyclase (GGDEF)-like protein/PAS domain S-box-containing protein
MSEIAEHPDSRPAQGQIADPFRQLAEAAPIAMMQVDDQGQAVFVNQRWRDLTDIATPTPIPRRELDRLVHPDDYERVIALFIESGTSLRPFEAEIQMIRLNGDVRRARIQSQPYLVDGVLSGFTSSTLDITEFVETTGTRDRSEQRYSDLMAKAPVGQVVYTLDGHLMEINEAGADLLGLRADDLVGTVAGDYLCPEDQQSLGELMGPLIRGEIPAFEVEHRLRHRDGHLFWVSNSITVERDALGRATSVHALTIDISGRKDAEDRLRQSEQRYRKLIDEAPVGQLISQVDGTLVEVNQAFLDLVGGTRKQVFARDPSDLLHPEDAIRFGTEIPRLLAGEIDAIDLERKLSRIDGSYVWVSGGTSLIRDGDQLFLHSVMDDVNQRKQAEAGLRASEERATTVIESLHEGLMICTSTEVLLANQSAGRILGLTVDELVGPFAKLQAMPVFDADGNPSTSDQQPAQLSLQTGEPFYEVMRGIEIRPREMRWCLTNAVPLFSGEDDRPNAVVVSFTDVTDSKQNIDALQASEDRFRTLTESLPVGVYQSDRDGHILYMNPQLSALVGHTEGPMSYQDALATVHPDDFDRVARGLLAVLRNGGAFHDQYRVVGEDGTVRWWSNRTTATLDENGAVNGLIGSVEDVTALLAVQEQNARLAGIIESTSDLVAITEAPTGRLTYLNRAARETFGLVDTDITQVSGLDLYADENDPVYRRSILPLMLQGESWSGELTMHSADGGELLVWQTMTPVLRADGTLHQVSTVGRDVTERRRFEADLAYQATHDSLTGLPNRALLLDHLELALARAERDNRVVALLFLDLDRFKSVNDTLGHNVGDELLAQAARLLTSVVRPSDTVARLGGDEFVILCDDVEDQDYAEAVARRVAAAIESRPFLVGDTELVITASIGIALSSGGQAHPEALLRDADAAMYRAKDMGRARLEIYDETMRRRTARRLELAEELAAGIEAGDIVVHFQPGVDLETGRIRCVEALARWNHPVNGLLQPKEFISLAEETGLIVGLGLRVLSLACEHGRRWEDQFGVAAPRVHVNLSARQLTTSNLPVLVQGVLEGSGLTPGNLCLEITESVLMDDASAVIDTLWELKAIGVTLAIDDFGTGYSSLSYLRRFPVDVLKIDQSFVAGLGPDPEDSTIVAAIVNLANTLELQTIAEGVETVDQLVRLRDLGCRMAQGYYFAEPAEAATITKMIDHGFVI